MKWTLISLSAAALVTGCYPIAVTAVIQVSGYAPAGQSCYLALWDSEGNNKYEESTILTGSFETELRVSPGRENLMLKAYCDNKVTNTYKIEKKTKYALGDISR